MGRITKERADQIAKLRREGYTQREVAEKVGVHLRTVRFARTGPPDGHLSSRGW